MNVLEVNNLYKYFTSQKKGLLFILDKLKKRPLRLVKAVDDVSLSLKQGEVVGLVGESGCGKTTLGKSILRLSEIDKGSVVINGENIGHYSPSHLKNKRRDFQLLYQNPESCLNPHMTVEQILKETIKIHKLAANRKESKQLLTQMLEKVGLQGKERAYPGQLSGGEKRRAGLARILMMQPKLIIADEPVSGLDAHIKRRIIDLMLNLKGKDTAYLIISHDLNLVRYACQRIISMYLGRVVEIFDNQVPNRRHHPYTEELLNASIYMNLPERPSKRGILAMSVKGQITQEDLSATPGCLYRFRCKYAMRNKKLMELCQKWQPYLKNSGRDGCDALQIACHRYL